MARYLNGAKATIRELMSIIKEKSIVREAWDKTLMGAKALCAVHVIYNYVGTVTITYGPSMLPTIKINGDYFLAERFSTRFGFVEPGDIVLLRSPHNPNKVMTKRLIAMEGQSVTYVVEPTKSDHCETIVVPKGHVWVEGDNIYNSNDSRKFGPVPYGLLQAKFCWKILPRKEFGPIKSRSVKDQVSDESLLSAEVNSDAYKDKS